MDQGPQLSLSNAERDFSDTRGDINLNDAERILSIAAGVGFAVFGLTQRSWSALVSILGGSYLAYRGITGHCHLYNALGVRTSDPDALGIEVDKSITISRSAEDLYRFWSNFENLPRFMKHLEAVWMTGDHRWHWIAKAPVGMTVEWDAEVIVERQYSLIAWQSLEGSEIPNEGSIRFEEAPEGAGTLVRVMMRYYPPGGSLGAWFASLFGEEPNQQIAEDLKAFKAYMEKGEDL